MRWEDNNTTVWHLCYVIIFFIGTVDRLKVIYKEKDGFPLNDDVVEVRQLCISVEEVLRHQQKGEVHVLF